MGIGTEKLPFNNFLSCDICVHTHITSAIQKQNCYPHSYTWVEVEKRLNNRFRWSLIISRHNTFKSNVEIQE